MLRYKIISKLIAPMLKVCTDKDCSTCYDSHKNCLIIGYDFNSDDCGFMRHLKENHMFPNAQNYSLSLWTILHEIGHYYTIDWADDDLDARILCAMLPKDKVKEDPRLQNIYFNIPAEWEATEWAIEWIIKHPRLAEIFNKIMR